MEVHILPDPCPHGIPRRRLTQADGQQALAERKCPEEQTVPAGSGDMCSTVHGSYQLSTDTLPPLTLPWDL